MTIGVMCAIPQELRHLRGALADEGITEIGGARFHRGTLDGHDVVLADTGMGKVNAAVVATLLADRFRCGAVVFTGVAGGLDVDAHIGDVVIAERAVQHDAGLVEDDRLQTYQAGHVQFINPTDRLGYDADPELLARVRERLAGFTLPAMSSTAGGHDLAPRITYGTILTGDQYLNCEVTRERLFRQFGGRAIEMEGAAVAQVCEAFDVPWLVVRALSDLAGRESKFDFMTFVEEVAASSAAILRRILPVLPQR